MMKQIWLWVLGGALLAGGAQAADPVLIKIPRLTVEAAQRVAQAALMACRKDGVQVAVTVVDRGGHPVVVMRDTLAPDLTLEISRQKAYTAMSFNAPLSTLEDRFTKPFSVGKVEGIVFSAGGLPIQAVSNILGGVGVSGAPTGEQDERCAAAGLKAIQDDLDLAPL
jgi:uncharacterized protein GlcG (DUF336 family)